MCLYSIETDRPESGFNEFAASRTKTVACHHGGVRPAGRSPGGRQCGGGTGAGAHRHYRGGLYTLSEGTQNILDGLEEPVTLKFFFNESLGELPVRAKVHARKVRELLEEYASRSGGKVTLEVIDPKPDSDEEEWAIRYGLQGAQLPTGNRMFLGLVALSGVQETTMPFSIHAGNASWSTTFPRPSAGSIKRKRRRWR